MTTIKKYSLLLFGAGLMIMVGCKKKDAMPPTVPQLTTTAVTNITSTTATSGGSISNNGGADITASGICWSKVNATPTIADDTTKGTTTSGSFVANLKNIDPSATYYVRAYATNSVGTGYGNVVSFSTGNGAPEAKNITISGTVQVAEKLTANYTYFDFESDAESGTTFQWYKANDGTGSGETAIAGATANTYTLAAADEFKYLRVGITAKASAGTSPGTEVKSPYMGPVATAPTTVTFTYNGNTVTYGIIVSSVTGRRWLDRNLGAPNAPTAVNDFANYGDAFQWGRGADGHQLTNRAASSSETTGVNGNTTALSNSDSPGHGLFILVNNPPNDWRSPQNHNLWQGVNGINNPCPSGFRIPTIKEWQDENLGLPEETYAQLKLTFGGRRVYRNGFDQEGGFASVAVAGDYWASDTLGVVGTPDADYGAKALFIDGLVQPGTSAASAPRSTGNLCRCIKD